MSHQAKLRRKARLSAVACALVVAPIAFTACSGSSSPAGGSSGSAGPPQHGGSITVLEDASFAGGYPSGLDPATNTTGGANITQQQAIFGGLFLIEANADGSGAKVVPNEASSYSFSADGKTLTIKLRDGIKFSDGTPLNASAVAWNFERDTHSSCTCAPQWMLAKTDPITAPDPLTVVVHFAQANSAIVNELPASNVNWIASPTALKKLGAAKFKIAPVGAGPFTVVSDKLSSLLMLKRNPNYFKKGLPYLDKLTFQSIGGDQPAYQALQAGQVQAYEGMSTEPLIEQAKSNPKLTVTSEPATSPYVVQLNTTAAPFNNKIAREAIYYATDFDAIAKGLFKDQYPVSQSFTAPGGLFYHKSVAGYRNYNLDKAKQLVQQLGGLKVQLGTTAIYTAEQVMTALQTQWKQAGIEVSTNSYQLSNLIQQFTGGKWQAMLQTAGAWDPAAGVGVAFRFASTSPFTGVKDPKLDAMFNEAVATTDQAKRDSIYEQAGKYISDNAYAPFGLAFAPANLAAKGVHAPGLTTKIPAILVNSGVLWDQAWTESG